LQDCRKDLTGLSKVVSPLLSAILQSCNPAIPIEYSANGSFSSHSRSACTHSLA
jgi:hypothetical protein